MLVRKCQNQVKNYAIVIVTVTLTVNWLRLLQKEEDKVYRKLKVHNQVFRQKEEKVAICVSCTWQPPQF